jgi:flagellar hook protein FlgE
MSLSSAMNAGVSGLISNSSALAAISDNIANSNTTGYKRVGVDFSSMVTDQALTSRYSAGGVMTYNTQYVDNQGTITNSSEATNLAISGNGFFVTTNQPADTSASDPRYFTRAGDFNVDQNGYLVNSAGLYLQGWPADASGNVASSSSNISSLQAINLNTIESTAEATTTVTASANLDSDQAINAAVTAGTYTAGDMALYATDPTNANAVKPDFTMQAPVADSKGGQRTLDYDFLKTGANTWTVEVRSDPASDQATPGTPIASGILTFNTDGSLVTPIDSNLSSITPQWASSLGVSDTPISVDLGKLTQLSSTSTTASVQANGTPFGTLAGINIDKDGFVTAVYQNGATRKLAQVAIATFPDANGLQAVSGDAYQASAASGGYTLKAPGDAGAGEISPSSLESSTVDLSTEFTGLITTQRAYSASSKIITTADEMMQDLLSVIR